MKITLIGRPTLQSTQHSLWVHISVEVAKMWDELNKLETKKDHIYSALDKCGVAKEKLQQLHKQPMEKALFAIKILNFSSQDALKKFNFKIGFKSYSKLKRLLIKLVECKRSKNRHKAYRRKSKNSIPFLKH